MFGCNLSLFQANYLLAKKRGMFHTPSYKCDCKPPSVPELSTRQSHFSSHSQIKDFLRSKQKFNTTGNLYSPLGPGYSRLPAGSRQPARGRTTATKKYKHASHSRCRRLTHLNDSFSDSQQILKCDDNKKQRDLVGLTISSLQNITNRNVHLRF